MTIGNLSKVAQTFLAINKNVQGSKHQEIFTSVQGSTKV